MSRRDTSPFAWRLRYRSATAVARTTAFSWSVCRRRRASWWSRALCSRSAKASAKDSAPDRRAIRRRRAASAARPSFRSSRRAITVNWPAWRRPLVRKRGSRVRARGDAARAPVVDQHDVHRPRDVPVRALVEPCVLPDTRLDDATHVRGELRRLLDRGAEHGGRAGEGAPRVEGIEGVGPGDRAARGRYFLRRPAVVDLERAESRLSRGDVRHQEGQPRHLEADLRDSIARIPGKRALGGLPDRLELLLEVRAEELDERVEVQARGLQRRDEPPHVLHGVLLG